MPLSSLAKRRIGWSAGLSLLVGLVVTGSANAAGVDEKLLSREMKFIEKIAKVGYFDAAREACKRAKTIPGMTETQKTFLDLSQAKISTQEILKDKDLKSRDAKLKKTVVFLKGLTEKLPKGSFLRAQAGAKILTTYIDVANGYVKEVDELELDVLGKVQKDLTPLKKRQAELRKMAQAAYETVVKEANPVRREMLRIFDNLVDRLGMIDDPARQNLYVKRLEAVFVGMEVYDHAVAGMYPNFAETYPRGSKKRREIFEKGYWYNVDVTEVHRQTYAAGGGHYVDYAGAMNVIQLAGLVDEPVVKATAKKKDAQGTALIKTLKADIPSPLILMGRTFKEQIVGKYKGKAAKNGQENRPKCLFYFGMSWLKMARGAYALLDAAKGDESREAWREHAERMVANCERVLDEVEKGKESVVGPVPTFIQELAQMEIQVPLLLLKARRAFVDKDKDNAKNLLSYAKSVTSNLLLDPDPMKKQASQRRMVVINATIEKLVPELRNERTPAEVIFEAERLHKAYRSAKARKAKRSEQHELLEKMRERYLEAKSLLRGSKLPRKVRAEYGSKCWYYIGLASLYLNDYYTAFIANQHILQSYRPVRYPAERYPQIERYRGYAARNVVTAAYRKQKETLRPFDRALYAESLIWRLSAGDQNVDFYYVVAEQYLKGKQFIKSYDWFERVPESSKLHRLAWLQKGQAALKKALSMDEEAERLEKKVAKLQKAKAEAFEILELKSKISNLQDGSKPWYDKARAAANQFIQMHESYSKKHGGGKTVPVHEKSIFTQEQQNKFAAYLLLMQVAFGNEKWAEVLQWAVKLTEDTVPQSMRASILPQAKLIHFMALIKSINLKVDPVQALADKLNAAEAIRAKISKYAAADDRNALSAIMVQGDSWLKLAARASDADASAYRLKAGNAFAEAVREVEKNVNYALLMGPIFTEQEMYDKAEEVYDLAIKVWDKEDKRPPMPSRKVIKSLPRTALIKYLGGPDAKRMQALHQELVDAIYPPKGADASDYVALAKISEIVRESRSVKVEGVTELPTKKILDQLKVALRYRSTMLRVKSGLVLAKVDGGKWAEAMSLVEDVLKVAPDDKNMQLLKATVLVRRAEKAGSLAKAKKDLDDGVRLIAKLTMHKTDKLPRFSPDWWRAMALFYEANRSRYLYEPEGKVAKDKAPKEMRMVRMWQKGRVTPTDEFIERTNTVYAAYEKAGFKELTLSKTKQAAMAQRSAASKERLERKAREEEDKIRKRLASSVEYLKSGKATPEDKATFLQELKVDREKLRIGWKYYPEEMKAWKAPALPVEKKAGAAK